MSKTSIFQDKRRVLRWKSMDVSEEHATFILKVE
jgi:hypothetical protein